MKLLGNEIKKEEIISSYTQIVLGCIIGGAAYPMFLTPNNIAPGGLTGVAIILNYLFQWPVGLVAALLNIPLFIIGRKAMGRVFVVRSFVATILFSVFIDLIKLPALTDDPLLSSIYGGVVLGVGLGLILRGGATTGGSDMVARMVHQKTPLLSVGMFLFLIDCIVVLAAAGFIGVQSALYAFISIFVSGKLVDVVMAGFESNKACFIMTEEWDKVSNRLITELERGVTQLTARGAYSGKERPVVMCVVSKQEVVRLKNIVREEDDSAFMFVTEAHEALGEGFSPWKKEE